jgi:hypothetical protein
MDAKSKYEINKIAEALKNLNMDTNEKEYLHIISKHGFYECDNGKHYKKFSKNNNEKFCIKCGRRIK